MEPLGNATNGSPESQETPSRRAPLIPLALYQALSFNRTSVLLVYFPLFLVEARGVSLPVALGLLSSGFIAGALVAPFAGRWSDRTGHRKAFLLAAEIAAFPLFLAIPFLPNAYADAAAFIGTNVALGFGSPVLDAFVADLSKPTERGSGYGLLAASGYAGSVSAFLLAALVTYLFGLAPLFFLVGALAAINLGVVAIGVPDLRVKAVRARPRWSEARPMVLFAIVVSVRALGTGALGGFYGVYATDLGAAAWQVALIWVAGVLVGALTGVRMGRLVDRVGSVRSVWYATGISLVAVTGFALAPVWWILVPSVGVLYLGQALVNPAMLAYVARLAGTRYRAQFLGIFTLVNSLFWSAGPSTGSIPLAVGGARGLFLFAAAMILLSLVGLALNFPLRGRGKERVGAAALPPSGLPDAPTVRGTGVPPTR